MFHNLSGGCVETLLIRRQEPEQKNGGTKKQLCAKLEKALLITAFTGLITDTESAANRTKDLCPVMHRQGPTDLEGEG